MGLQISRRPLPVAGETVISLRTQSSGGGKHNGGVQISNDSTHSARRINTGLSTSGSGLERRKNKGYLLTDTPSVLLEVAASVLVVGVALDFAGVLYQLHTALTQVLDRRTDTVRNLQRENTPQLYII